jgi:hypothetical protein
MSTTLTTYEGTLLRDICRKIGANEHNPSTSTIAFINAALGQLSLTAVRVLVKELLSLDTPRGDLCAEHLVVNVQNSLPSEQELFEIFTPNCLSLSSVKTDLLGWKMWISQAMERQCRDIFEMLVSYVYAHSPLVDYIPANPFTLEILSSHSHLAPWVNKLSKGDSVGRYIYAYKLAYRQSRGCGCWQEGPEEGCFICDELGKTERSESQHPFDLPPPEFFLAIISLQAEVPISFVHHFNFGTKAYTTSHELVMYKTNAYSSIDVGRRQPALSYTQWQRTSFSTYSLPKILQVALPKILQVVAANIFLSVKRLFPRMGHRLLRMVIETFLEECWRDRRYRCLDE